MFDFTEDKFSLANPDQDQSSSSDDDDSNGG